MKEGWEYRKLGEICDFRSGFAFKSNKFTKIGEPIIRISDIQNEEIDDSNLVYFDPKSYTEDLSKYLIYPDDILIAMSGGTTGKIGINTSNRTYYLNQRVGVFRENKKYLNHRYLFYFLHTKAEESLKIAAGAAQPNLSTAQIKSFIIPVSHLSEQQHIVNYLDSAFAKIDAMKANAEKSLNEAKALFQASLKEMLEPKEGWEEMKLGKFAYMKAGNFVKANDIYSEYQEGLYPCYGGNGFRGWVKEANQEGDYCLIGRQGALCGCINRAKGVFRTTEHAVIVKPYNPIPTGLVYYLLINLDLNKYATGAAQPGLSVKNIAESVIISIPPLSEQQSIVATLDSLKSKVDRLRSNFEKIAQECDALEQAILRQIFE